MSEQILPPLIKTQSADLQAVSANLDQAQCVGCSQVSLRPLYKGYGFDDSKESFKLYQCTHCGLVCIHPLLTLSELSAYYHSDYYGGGQQRKSGQKFNVWVESLVDYANFSRGKHLLSYLEYSEPKNVKILDVGCGRGVFLKSMARRGFTCVGTDISEFEQQGSAGYSFHQGSIEAIGFPSHYFDAVSIWHVLEHTLNPSMTIGEIARILKPGGVVAIAVPNFGSWQSRLFGKHWFHLDLPRHLYHFTQASLLEILKAQQLELIQIKTYSLDQNPFGFIQSALNVLFYQNSPNGLYSLLKNTKRLSHQESSAVKQILLKMAFYILATFLLLPALIESLVSEIFKKGATLIVYARKKT